MSEELKQKLLEARKNLGIICEMLEEDSNLYNVFMNGFMYIDEATRMATGECPLSRKWLHYYADRCVL